MRIAVAQYPIERIASVDAYVRKVTRLVDEAANRGAQFLVFPEYAALELLALNPEPGAVREQLRKLQKHRAAYVDVFSGLAKRYDIVIVAGTFPEQLRDASFRNRAYVFGPSELTYQDKLHLTPWEKDQWGISAGKEIRVFHAERHVFAVNVCLDVELPAQARRQGQEGATLIVVPSSTDSAFGWNRVRTGCLARALENHCFVAMSPTVGSADWSKLIDTNFGVAGVFAPMFEGFPVDGVLAQGEFDAAGWVYADLDFVRLAAVRDRPTVQNVKLAKDTVAILQGDVDSFRFSRAWHGDAAAW